MIQINLIFLKLFLEKWNHTDKMKIVNQKTIFIYKILSTIRKTVDTFVFIATTFTSLTFFVVELGMVVIPVSTAIAFVQTFTNEDFLKVFMKSYNKTQNNLRELGKLSFNSINYPENGYKILRLLRKNMIPYGCFYKESSLFQKLASLKIAGSAKRWLC